MRTARFKTVFIEVRRRKTGPEVNRSWKLIETALSQYPQILKTSTGVMYTALSKWTLDAWDEYVAASKAEGLPEPATPEYVNVIRRYRRSVSVESSRANHAAAEGGIGGRTLPDMDFESLQGALPDDEHFGFSDFPTISSFEIDPGEWVQWDQVVGGEGGFPFTQGMSDFPN